MPKSKSSHPTIFVMDGSVKVYEQGSMLELHSAITTEEWQAIVAATYQYKIFIECLKDVAVPILKETWDENDDYIRVQLEVAISRMRNIDPILVAKLDGQREEAYKTFSRIMLDGATNIAVLLNEYKSAMDSINSSNI